MRGIKIMNLSNEFILWIKENLIPPEFRSLTHNEFPYAENFDLILKRTGSIMKGNQWYLFKAIPSGFTEDQANRFAFERKQIIKAKSKFFKWLADFCIFFYVSESPVSQEVFNCLGNFYKVNKRIFSNVHEIKFYYDLSTGQYIQPKRTGYIGWIPIRNLIREAQRFIFEPYNQWLRSPQESLADVANFCQSCGISNPRKMKFCEKCGFSLSLSK